MMKNKIFLILGIFILFLYSCKEKENSGFSGSAVHFGESTFYHPFLGVNDDTILLTKNLEYKFNNFALQKKSFVNINLVDEKQNNLTDENIQLFIDGKRAVNNTFKLDGSNQSSGKISVGILLLPNYKEGYSTGFLSLNNHSLDIINNTDLTKSNIEKRLFKWEVSHQILMNPLKKYLLWIMGIVTVALLIWFITLRNILHPKFKKGKIQILSPYFGGVNISKSTKLVIFTNTIKKQGTINRLFTGKIIYEVNPIYTNEIKLRPGRKNKIKIKLPIGARITPPVINLEKFNTYKIEVNKQIIEIQYS